MSWKQLSSKVIFRNKWMWLTEDEVETESGHKTTYAVLHKKPFALIIPWDGRYFTIVGQYRYQVRTECWEFPQGHCEHSSIEETARKELQEETGLLAAKIEPLGSFFAIPGAIDQECRVFLATNLIQGESELEETEEGLKSRKVTPQQLEELIRSGEVKDGPTIAALSLLLMRDMI